MRGSINKILKDLIEWNEVCNHFMGVDIIEAIDSFVGSSYLCNKIEEEIFKVINEKDNMKISKLQKEED